MSDLISRQAVEDALYEYSENNDVNYNLIITEYIDTIPSVKQVPKTGHWIYDRTRDWDGECKYECSECGMGSDVDYAYCMRCGAKMVDPQESEE